MAAKRRNSIVWSLIVLAVVAGLWVTRNRLGRLGGGEVASSEPIIKVFFADTGEVKSMPIEEYVKGVVAGEVKSYWPKEALASQAIIARTFALKTLEEKRGTGPQGSDISTSWEEAQAYDPKKINKAISDAVDSTRGKVITYRGQLINAWFHSNAGGKTATAKEGLNYRGAEPPYVAVRTSPDMTAATDPKDKTWSAVFSTREIESALARKGLTISGIRDMSIAQRGPSGRAQMIAITHDGGRMLIGGNDLRVALDPMRMRSNYLTRLEVKGDRVEMAGKGYGHGVGLSQWGAYNMARAGKTHEQILKHYFRGIKIEKRWP